MTKIRMTEIISFENMDIRSLILFRASDFVIRAFCWFCSFFGCLLKTTDALAYMRPKQDNVILVLEGGIYYV